MWEQEHKISAAGRKKHRTTVMPAPSIPGSSLPPLDMDLIIGPAASARIAEVALCVSSYGGVLFQPPAPPHEVNLRGPRRTATDRDGPLP